MNEVESSTTCAANGARSSTCMHVMLQECKCDQYIP